MEIGLAEREREVRAETGRATLRKGSIEATGGQIACAADGQGKDFVVMATRSSGEKSGREPSEPLGSNRQSVAAFLSGLSGRGLGVRFVGFAAPSQIREAVSARIAEQQHHAVGLEAKYWHDAAAARGAGWG
jgi:hypothetical protein